MIWYGCAKRQGIQCSYTKRKSPSTCNVSGTCNVSAILRVKKFIVVRHYIGSTSEITSQVLSCVARHIRRIGKGSKYSYSSCIMPKPSNRRVRFHSTLKTDFVTRHMYHGIPNTLSRAE